MKPVSVKPSEPEQQIIAVPEIEALLARADEGEDPIYERLMPTERWTRDPVFLLDVPVACDDSVSDITIETVNEHGERVNEQRKGKVVTRRAPHPEFVRQGKHLVHRLAAEPQGLAQTPVMCDLTTVIKYNNGVVQQIHLDVLHAILHLLHDRFVRTGVAHPRIRTTYHDIAGVLDRPMNGRIINDINNAGETLSGLHVSKYYGWMRQDQTVEPAAAEHWGSIISYFSPNAGPEERRGKGSRGPRRQSVIFEVHAALMRALTGQGADRLYITRPLNLTKNLGYRLRWKKHLHRILESRFDATGQFYMPLAELWISCFGNQAADITVPKKLYQVRHDLKTFLTEMTEVGFLAVGELVMGRSEGVTLTRAITLDQQAKRLNLDGREIAEVVNCQDWVRATPGPTYWAQKKPGRRDFACDILGAVLSEAQTARVLKDHEPGLIIEVGYQRLKTLLNAFGDRVSRLPIDAWFGAAYPREPEELTIRRLIIDRARHTPRDGDAEGLYHQRGDMAARWIRKVLKLHDLDEIIAEFLRRAALSAQEPIDASAAPPEADEGDTQERLHRYMGMALRILVRTLNLDPVLAQPAAWAGENAAADVPTSRLQAEFRKYARIVADAAVRGIGLVGWYGHMGRYIAGELGTDGAAVPAPLWNRVRARHPELGEMIAEMLDARRPEWEKALAYRLQRRATEAHLELQRIAHYVERIQLE